MIYLRWIEGKSYEEIAAVLGCTTKQIRDRHRRGLLTLQSIIRDSTGSSCRGHARAN